MATSRRFFLTGRFGATATACLGQGVTAHKAAAPPRGKPSGLPFNARFTDVAAQAGLRAVTVYGESDHKEYIVETLGCGCALDFDNDGWLDVFLLSGTRFTDAPSGVSNCLFKNNHDGTFTDVTERAGLLKTGWACGVCVGDYNNDGFDDLFVTYWGQNVLYRNNGDGTFTDVTQAAGLKQSSNRWGTGCTFLDYNRDGNLDLFVANYLDFDLQICPKPGQTANCRWMGVPVTCGPRGFPHGQHSPYRNKGDRTFADVSLASGIVASKNSYGLTAIAADFDDDGWPDIYVACDSTPSLLFMNNHDGTFREEGAIRGVAYGEDGQEQAGAAVGDFDIDGRFGIFKTNLEGDTPDLYRNMGKANFEEVSPRAGLAVENRHKTVIFRGLYSLILLSASVGVLAIAMSTQTPFSAAQTADSSAAADTHPEFPPGEGREAVLRLCVKCHSPNIILASGQDRRGWENTITKMARQGAEGSDEDFTDIADYLTANFPPSAVKKVFVNMATEKQISDVLGISLDDAKAIVAYRDKVKGFKSLEDMKAVPNVDAKKIDAKKDQLVFGAGVTKP